jgi:nucleoside-diphosphate-sugar epimerase
LVRPSDIVLITGAEGFTGRALLPAIRATGATTIGVGYHGASNVDHLIDLLDRNALRRLVEETRPTHVVHLAGISAPTHRPVAEIYAANVVGTVNLLEALAVRAEGIQRVILPSSATIYAQPADGRPIGEDDPIAPGGHYAASKLAMETASGFFRGDLPVQIVRPFNYTGVGQRESFFVPKVVNHFASGATTLRVGDLSLARDISDLADVVETLRRLLEAPNVCGPLNICSGSAVQLSRVIDVLSEISGRSIEVIVDSALVRPGETSQIVGSRKRLDAHIGCWDLRPLEQTLTEMYRAARREQADAR